ncbi:MAG: M28 family peptidase [Acidobacteria bacterium]|nr:M28 family peptidase [Acidobacteriota bacterium]
MKRFHRVLCAAFLLVSAGVSGDTAPIDASRYIEHVKFLASDELQGRGNGTEGLEKAARYIADRFRAFGLLPGAPDGTYSQAFEIVTGLQIGSKNALTFSTGAAQHALQLGFDYYPASVGPAPGSSPDALPLVFAGYGISAPAFQYDDYASVEVKDKAVLVLTHEPQENDPNSRFDGKANTLHSELMNKAMVARAHGARLVILVEDPAHVVEQTKYDSFLKDPQADEYGVPVVRVRRDALKRALGGALDLDAVFRDIEGDLQPRSKALEKLSVSLVEDFGKIRRTVFNVVASLEGADATKRREVVVIGAHYDHLGLGGRHSLAPSLTGEIHNGADDNASGTAALLEIARAAALERSSFPRTLVFLAFAGEELGLLGSSYFVNHPTVPLDRVVAMINLDMIGRPSGRILVSGLDSSPALADALKAASAGVPIEVKTFGQGASVGSSDDTSFLLHRIPSIGFFSGFHADYHRPSDDWGRIDATGGTQVARIAFVLARTVAARAERPEFVRTVAAHGGTASATSGGYGPYFGSVPDFAEEGTGVKFADVRDGSPAAKAGFRRGDVMISFGAVAIKNIYDFTFALRNKRPGDTVEVVVLREGKEVRATVELTNRP